MGVIFISIGKNFKKLVVSNALACMSFVPVSSADQRVEIRKDSSVKESWNTLAGYQDREKQENSWNSIRDQQDMISQPENQKDLDTKTDAQSFREGVMRGLGIYAVSIGFTLLFTSIAFCIAKTI